MLFLLLILSGLGPLTSMGRYWETPHLQITVPQKLGTNTNDGDASETHVTYAIKIDRKTYTLHLEKQSILDPHFLVYSYNKSGALYSDSSFVKGHCFYQGYAAEIPKSVVILSICSGLRGLLQLENVSYGIEPLESAAMYEHMLYQIESNKTDFFPLQENGPIIQLVDQPYKILVKSEKISDMLLRKTLKVQIIMDKVLYDYMGSEVAVAVEKVVQIFGLVNAMFSQLKVTVMLTSLEIWSDQNKILSNGDANEILQRFVSWKEKFLFQRSHDMAFLLIYRNYPNYVGATYHGKACDLKLAAGIALKRDLSKQTTMNIFQKRAAPQAGPSGGIPAEDIVVAGDSDSVHAVAPDGLPVGQEVEVEDSDLDDPDAMEGYTSYPKRISLEAFSVVMAQLLGVNLGISYDDIYNCYCPGTTCIMNPQAIRAHGVKFFSSCSMDEFKHVVSQPELKCLQNQTVSKLVVQGRQSVCGNGRVETGEQCDCGLSQDCAFKKCCDPNTCTLLGYAECGTGSCCDKKSCLISERGRVCRMSTDPCDFTEYCTGLSEYCVPDMKAADLEPCNNKSTYCYGGVCQDPDRHCMELFGKFAKGADYLCTEEVNIQSDSFGNCGKRCNFGDSLCGKIVCHWSNTHIVVPSAAYNLQYTYYGGHVCISAYMRGSQTIDRTYIPDGTVCGENKFCHKNVCKFVSDFPNTRCNSTEKCHGHGTCNSKGNCHCDSGFAPPFCEPSLSSPGGSVDDGFWILADEKIINLPRRKQRAAPKKTGILISFCVFLPFLILIAIIALKKNQIKFGVREETVSERSISEKSSSNSSTSYPELKVTYAIKIGRKTYTLHLEKQSFLDPHFLVYLYNKSGTLYQDSSFIKGHCFYQGYAAEVPKSVVIFNICSGLRGLLQLEDVSYGIEPLESAAMYEHMLYKIKTNKTDFFSLQEKDPMLQMVNESYKILVKSQEKSDVVLLKRNLKIQIIMDKALYDYMGSEVAVAVEKVVQIFGLINAMFSQLKVTVMLTSLEIWSDQNKILSNGDANEILQRFVSWKEKFLFQRSHDMAFLLIYRNYPNYVGATYHGKACDPKLAAGIALYPKRISLEAFSVVMAQLLGVNLGISYDDIYNCYCPGATCIMNLQAIHAHGVKLFSTCSVDEFKHIVSQPELKCLQNQTVSKLVVQERLSTCGNGRVEIGEQCDCGLPEKCDFNKCCDPLTCMLIGLAECGTGPCCNKKSCLIVERGHVCRLSNDPCDFTEYCNGLSEYCGPDMKAADLEPCNNKSTYCFGGVCQDPDRHCMELFGKFAKGADYLCTEEVNIQSDIFGNCGKRCNFGNVLCGKLVCHWAHTHIVPSTAYDMQYTYYGGHVCISATMREKSTIDKTYIRDGTICGVDKFCHKKKCLETSDHRNANCNSTEKCRGHGVCNTNDNCHCDVGFAPPFCEPSQKSPGGSVDDGYWILFEDKNANLPRRKPHAAVQNTGLLISLCIFLPFLILIAIIVLKQNKTKFGEREETVSEGSTSANSSSSSSTSYKELK